MLFGCENINETSDPSTTTLNTTESDSFDESTLQDEIESKILACELSPDEVDVILLSTSNENLCCSIHSSWSENTSTFLTECYYIIPVVKELISTYECNYSSIDISSQNPNSSDKMRRLTYLSDNDITLLDSSGDDILTTTYNYEQLNSQNTISIVEYDIYSDEYVSFEYNKNLFTINPSDDKLTIAIKCPTMPEAPAGSHNTVLGIVTQENQYISEISKDDVNEALETIAKTICQGLFELNEGETIVSENTKYSNCFVEYSMEINDGSLCYAKAINYNTFVTTVVLRICNYSKDYNNAFLDIYNSTHSEFGNYSFNAPLVKETPTEEALSPTDDLAVPMESLTNPIVDSPGTESSSSIATSNGQSSPNIDTSTDIVTNNTPQPTANQSFIGDGNTDNFNTYDNVEQQQTEASYVLNTHTMKIHYPSCSSVKKIAPQNYSTSNSTIDELKAQGYTTCGNCFK